MFQEIKHCFAHPLEQLNRLLDGSYNELSCGRPRARESRAIGWWSTAATWKSRF